jgi:outer membrane murein-binding lipoprotein Lpp
MRPPAVIGLLISLGLYGCGNENHRPDAQNAGTEEKQPQAEVSDAVTELAGKYAALEHEAKGTPSDRKASPPESSSRGNEAPKQ